MQTPREVYDRLKKEGYRVQYYRLPLTDGEAPKERIFDVFYHHVKDVPPSDALIFNCQMGGGRTTTGMVIGCLIRMHTSGQLLSALKLIKATSCFSDACESGHQAFGAKYQACQRYILVLRCRLICNMHQAFTVKHQAEYSADAICPGKVLGRQASMRLKGGWNVTGKQFVRLLIVHQHDH